jgi:prevent-host-death family protein
VDHVPEGAAGLAKWNHQDARARFAELVRRARAEGPQLVTTRGADPVVVLSADAYFALLQRRPTKFSDLLMPFDDFEPMRLDITAEYEPIQL